MGRTDISTSTPSGTLADRKIIGISKRTRLSSPGMGPFAVHPYFPWHCYLRSLRRMCDNPPSRHSDNKPSILQQHPDKQMVRLRPDLAERGVSWGLDQTARRQPTPSTATPG